MLKSLSPKYPTIPAHFSALLALCGITPAAWSAQSMLSADDRAALAIGHSKEVIIEFYDGGATRLAAERRRRAGIDYDSDEIHAEQVEYYRRQKAAPLAALSDAPSFEIMRDYKNLPLAAARIGSAADLNALLQQPNVKAVYPNEYLYASLTQSLPLIRQPEARAQGYAGAGTTVAVLDTGVDYKQSAFGTCPGSSCKVIHSQDFAREDYTLDDNTRHGTNVAGIVLGVAPAAKVIALDVFDGEHASSNSVIDAIDWSVENKSKYNIVAINMSLGDVVSYSTTCTSSPYTASIAKARARGIIPVAASGNEGYTNGIESPACTPGTVSVGAVYDADAGAVWWEGCADNSTHADLIACFSNSARMLTLLAPGAEITAAGVTMGGTSQATPHVAGAVAVLRAAYPNESLDATIARMTKTGKPVTDPRNGITKPRLDLSAALGTANGTGGTGGAGGGTTSSTAFPPQDRMPAEWSAPTTSSANWFVAGDWASEGMKSLRSGKIADSRRSRVKMTSSFKAGNIRFVARTSTEACCDKLFFYVDNVPKGAWSGDTTQTVSIPITAGSHTLMWSYEKDSSGAAGRDTVWIDAVSFPPSL